MKKIILIIAIILLSGCYDYNELTDLAIVSSMVIDYKDEEYVVNLEILETKENAPKTSFFLEGKGESFEKALIDIYAKTPKHIYFNHMFAVILGESIAKDKLENIYDFFTIDNDVRKDTIFVMMNNPEELLNFETEDKLSIGETIKSIFKYSELENGRYKTVNFREILNSYLNNKNYLLTSIKIDDNVISLSDVYLISNDKLSLKLNSDIVLVANIIEGDVSSFIIGINGKSYQIYKSQMDIKILKDEIDFKLSVDARLFGKSRMPNSTKEDVKTIENEISSYLKECIYNSLKFAIDSHQDIYNLDYKHYLYYPKESYEKIFERLKYRLNVDATFNEKGLLLNKMGDEKDER